MPGKPASRTRRARKTPGERTPGPTSFTPPEPRRPGPGSDDADELTRRHTEQRELLDRALAVGIEPLDFDTLKQPRPAEPELDAELLDTPREPLPKPPGVNERLPARPGPPRWWLPHVRREYHQRVIRVMQEAEEDFAAYREAEAKRLENLEKADRTRVAVAAWEAVRDQHAEIDRYAVNVRSGDPHGVCHYFHRVLTEAAAADPGELVKHVQPGYEPDNLVLKLRYELPEPTVVPDAGVVEVDGRTVVEPLGVDVRDRLYLELICRIVLRAARAVLLADPNELVDRLVIHGVVSTMEETELVPEQVCVLSVAVPAAVFHTLDLAGADPVVLITDELGGNLTPNVASLQPVAPVRLVTRPLTPVPDPPGESDGPTAGGSAVDGAAAGGPVVPDQPAGPDSRPAGGAQPPGGEEVVGGAFE